MDVDELQEFGMWVTGGMFNNNWMLERLVETLDKTGGVIKNDFKVLATLAKLASEYPLICARGLTLIVKSRQTDRMTLGHNKDIGRIVTQLLTSSEIDAQTEARRIVDHLTKLGFEDFRAILSAEQPPKPESDGWFEAEENPGRPLAMK